jgi:tetratricopeptide (TPR) repeat protein
MLHNRTERCPSLWLPLAVLALVGVGCSWARAPVRPSKTGSSLAAAKTQLDLGKLESAEETLWNLLASEPTNEQALTMLGVVRGRQQRYPEAEALFRRVLQLNPKSIVASRNLAGALLAQEKTDDAIRQYHQAIQLSPGDSDLKVEVAQLELARGNFAEALSTIDTISPGRLPGAAIPLKAASLVGVGREADAEGLISRAQGSPGIALDLAHVFVEAHQSEAALKALSLVNPVPKSLAAQVYYLKGRALREKGSGAAAMDSFRQAIAANPKSVESLVAMAEGFAAEKKHADSVAMLQRARVLSPESRDILRYLIVEAMQAGQNDRALQAAQDLQSKSTELDDRYLIASVMVQQKQYLAATRILEDYVGQRPQDARAYLGLGISYLNLLRYPDARQALEKSLQLQSDVAETEFQLGLVDNQEGNHEAAVRRWQRAVELQPHHAQALFSLGTVYLESGDLAQAETAFSGSLAADPRNMKTEYDLALVLNKLGKSAEAKQHFDHYRKMQEEEHATSGNPPVAVHP